MYYVHLMELAHVVTRRGLIPLWGGVAFLPVQGKKDGVVLSAPLKAHSCYAHFMGLAHWMPK
jgi:hypothetical protein